MYLFPDVSVFLFVSSSQATSSTSADYCLRVYPYPKVPASALNPALSASKAVPSFPEIAGHGQRPLQCCERVSVSLSRVFSIMSNRLETYCGKLLRQEHC